MMMTITTSFFIFVILSGITTTTVIATSTTTPSDIILELQKKAIETPSDPSIWKQLGKIQLDKQEYAEAFRIFRYGSSLCPNDSELKHHVQVYETFHGTKTKATTTTTSSSLDDKENDVVILPSYLKMPLYNSIDEIFLTLDCPKVPEPIMKWKGDIPSDKRVNLIHASKLSILNKEQCQYLIDTAKNTAAKKGWTTNRHIHAPTCDIPIHDLPTQTQIWIKKAFDDVIYTLIQQAFGNQICLHNLKMQDCFIVRYDGKTNSNDDSTSTVDENPQARYAELKPHQDESLISITIALNDMTTEYEDGGLFIYDTQDLLNGPAGTIMCFAGSLIHGGYPVKNGTRWILTAFLYPDSNLSNKQPGYTLKDI